MKNKKYESCTSPMGEHCSKHGVTHVDNFKPIVDEARKNLFSVKHSFKPRRDGRYPLSRPFAITGIKCDFKRCPANRYNECIEPSCIKINSEGVCEMYVKLKKE